MTPQKHVRILSIAPSTRGFGFAVLDVGGTLANWGTKTAKGKDKNAESLVKANEVIGHYRPDVLVLEDTSAKHSRRAPRIRKLSKRIIKLAAKNKLRVRLFSREQVMKSFFPDGKGTKYALAELIAQKFPEELAHRLPPERREWMCEDSRIAIFDAVALAILLYLEGQSKRD